MVGIPLAKHSADVFFWQRDFVVVVYRHYMKAINVLSMFITNATESSSFISNNTLAILCDVPVFMLWVIAVWAKCKSKPTSYKNVALPGMVLAVFLVFTKDSMMGLPPYNLPVQYYNAYIIYQRIKQAASHPLINIDCKQDNA